METMDITLLMLLISISGLLIGYWLSETSVYVSWPHVRDLRSLEQPQIQACKMEYILRCLRYIHHRIIVRTGTVSALTLANAHLS